jgi:hypothetical protein
MASRRSAVVSGEEQLPRTQPPNGLIHLVIGCCKSERAMADGGGRVGVCAGRRIRIRIRRRPRYRLRLALRWDACCDACDACNAWLHKERGPCNPDDTLAWSCFYIFSLLASPSRYH